jgi:tetratricopeptide (TPR) repeat protein
MGLMAAMAILMAAACPAYGDKAANHFNQALAEVQRGDCRHAIHEASKAIQRNQNYTDAYLLRAQAENCVGAREDALKDIATAISISPGEAKPYLARGIMEAGRRDFSAAIEDANKAIQLEPKNAMAYALRGMTQFTNGNTDRAVADLDKAIRMQPSLLTQFRADFAEAYYTRGKARIAKGDLKDLDGGIADLTQAIELNPSYRQAYQARAEARKAKGDIQGANEDLARAAALR